MLTDRQIKLVVGSLLHDIGKVVYRSGDGRNHSTSGYDFLKNEAKIEDAELLNCVRYHHGKYLKNAQIAADDLAPSETVQLDKSKVLGVATMYGSSKSHTAILARTRNIPAVIGLGEDLLTKYDGKMAVIDGFTGMLYSDRDEETM